MADDVVEQPSENPLDSVWADVWNPEPNVWAPTHEDFPAYGEDAGVIGYQEHADIHSVEPMSEQYGHEASGTVPPAGMNLLTDVKNTGTTPAPVQVIRHEVQTYESGAEAVRFHQEVVQGLASTVLLMQNENRKRALLKVTAGIVNGLLPLNVSGQSSSGFIYTVPAGHTYSNLSGVNFTFVTSAVAGARQLVVTVRSPLNQVIATYTMSVTQAASLTQNYQTLNGAATDSVVGTTHFFPNILAGLTLPGGSTITISNAGFTDPGDSFNPGPLISGTDTPTAAVFIMALRDGNNVGATLQGWVLNPGDPPLEVKSQAGVEAVVSGGSGVATVFVYEELISDAKAPSLSQ